MQSQVVLGVVLLLVGLVMLYFLRGFILDLILLVLGALAVLIAFVVSSAHHEPKLPGPGG